MKAKRQTRAQNDGQTCFYVEKTTTGKHILSNNKSEKLNKKTTVKININWKGHELAPIERSLI